MLCLIGAVDVEYSITSHTESLKIIWGFEKEWTYHTELFYTVSLHGVYSDVEYDSVLCVHSVQVSKFPSTVAY
jgi:hypothetical protein